MNKQVLRILEIYTHTREYIYIFVCACVYICVRMCMLECMCMHVSVFL